MELREKTDASSPVCTTFIWKGAKIGLLLPRILDNFIVMFSPSKGYKAKSLTVCQSLSVGMIFRIGICDLQTTVVVVRNLTAHLYSKIQNTLRYCFECRNLGEFT